MNFDFLKSSNFWTALVLAIGGLFVGFQPELGADLVTQAFGLLATAKALREYFKNSPKVDAEGAVNNSNWWNYVATVVTSIVSTVPGGLFESLQDIMSNIFSANWQGVLISLFSLATIIYNLVQSKKKEPGSSLS